jgi:hypothetical protein
MEASSCRHSKVAESVANWSSRVHSPEVGFAAPRVSVNLTLGPLLCATHESRIALLSACRGTPYDLRRGGVSRSLSLKMTRLSSDVKDAVASVRNPGCCPTTGSPPVLLGDDLTDCRHPRLVASARDDRNGADKGRKPCSSQSSFAAKGRYDRLGRATPCGYGWTRCWPIYRAAAVGLTSGSSGLRNMIRELVVMRLVHDSAHHGKLFHLGKSPDRCAGR